MNELRSQINYLNEKVNSLEKELAVNKELENVLFHNDSLLFSVRRTPCLGNCPVYNFKVYKDGFASYEGSNFVDMLGVYTAELTQRQMYEVEKIFREAHFYTFKDEYDDSRLDIPSMIIEYHGNRGIKKVVARTSIPQTFRAMVVDLHELSDSITWKPVE